MLNAKHTGVHAVFIGLNWHCGVSVDDLRISSNCPFHFYDIMLTFTPYKMSICSTDTTTPPEKVF